MEHLRNEKLPVILENWEGNPILGKEFQYLDRPFKPDWKLVLKMMLSSNPQALEKKNDQWTPEVFTGANHLKNKNNDWILWLGHATFLIQLGGIRLITDPVLFDLPFLSRKVNVPFDFSLLSDIDYILLSHDHRDHCDQKSFQILLKQNSPTILTSLKMKQVIGPWIGDTPCQEAGWFQQFLTKEKNLRITYLPAQHWCRRGLTDFNRRLWGSFMIEYKGYAIYFGADSAAGSHFAQIGGLFDSIDLAILGIGAYKPAYMMKDNHTSPAEAFSAFKQLNAKKMIPMHYGTYDLSNEPISEPYRNIQQQFKRESKQNQLILPGVNEVIKF